MAALNHTATDETITDEVARIFAKFDENGDGLISATELRGLLHSLGSKTTTEEVAAMMAEMDKDGDGYVDLTEFAAFHAASGGNVGSTTELREAFSMFDKDGNGRISARELHAVLKSLGEKCSLKDCSKMIQSVDADGDGHVDFEEFKKMMANGLMT
ncbi:putative calcium-binding protein CML18 [Silene latifolia]|uniref:putative calcium-binding protein CML18 n=1 Tax=Silene latifolia TaxID=37657 RepID=UPI003D76F2A8